MSQLASRHGLGRAALTGAALGCVFGVHAAALGLGAAPPALQPWCVFACALAAFHMLEFVWSAAFEPATVNCDAFLLNHSPQYHAALAAAVAEFWVEALALAPRWKGWGPLSLAGLALVVGGQALRTAAMWRAGAHFTHLVAESRREGHELVTGGVYSVLRHPSYTGWFWWSVGTQLLLGNPLCTLAWAAASWRFFAERIPHEEALLLGFFGDAYAAYARRTAVGIPGMPSAVSGAGSAGLLAALPPGAAAGVIRARVVAGQLLQRVRAAASATGFGAGAPAVAGVGAGGAQAAPMDDAGARER